MTYEPISQKKLQEKNRFTFKVSKKAKIRVRYNQVPHLTQDTTWESDKNTRKHHKQESQEVSPFSAGDHKAAMKKQESMKNRKHKNMINKRSTALELSVKTF